MGRGDGMTGTEERVLKQYLGIVGDDFEKWCALRHESDGLERHYNLTLGRAKEYEEDRMGARRAVSDRYKGESGAG